MTLTIDGKEYTLHFGLDFIRKLDQIYRAGSNEYNFGMGINSAYIYLSQANPVILFDLIYAGLITDKERPSKAKIEEFILDSDIEKLCDDFFTALREAKATKGMIAKIDAEEAERKAALMKK